MRDPLQVFAGVAAREKPDIELRSATPAKTIPRWEPFPVECLPTVVRTYAVEHAKAIGADPASVAIPILSMLGAAIGTTRAIRLKRTWRAFPIVWTCCIARSGSMKTPTLAVSVDPLRRIQSDAFRHYEQAVKAFNAEMGAGKNQSKHGTEHPVCARYIVSDTTTEALAPILKDNPRGVLLCNDELAGLVMGFNQYKGGRGADAARWLQFHEAGSTTIDRKTQEPRTIHLSMAAVSICGNIQPGVAKRVFNAEHIASGLVARILFYQPPERLKRWSEVAPSQDVDDWMNALVRRLTQLTHEASSTDNEPTPKSVSLAGGAKAVWEGFYNEHAKRIADAGTDEEAASLSKIESYAARFALIVQLASDPHSESVGPEEMRAGVRLARWFASEQERIYASLWSTEETRTRLQLVAYIERRGGSVTVRDLVRGPREYRDNSDEARAALQELVASGLGRWDIQPSGEAGGRRSEVFILANGVATKLPATKPPFLASSAEVLSPVAK